ncbi:Cobalt transport protein CbiN [Rhodovastum atsumiense]|uniref:Cobalt transport protein CbiN n=1 Tax=Rhodovastum atsumiense TaxID=504468 RepID=A0A5M6IWX3_9PROT|nr:energy-coupling factor ABC transporter substrate-binding protein [Rhodovastum atsumiense]KAA5612826.1 energy-coupling factor ABC transporter substrate-binding protein [Rhodovastum atsumiense]CAH2601109.1 Cobalt transport protein CbiN [Rhodovastum atsumiense]
MRTQNILLGLGVVALAVLPLVLIQPAQEGEEIFGGSDDRATKLIETIHPGYKPWFTPLWEPPSGEVASMLFGVQSALGAGALAYALGFWRGRRQARRDDAARD